MVEIRIRAGVVATPVPAAVELLKLLLAHPSIELTHVMGEAGPLPALAEALHGIEGLPPLRVLDRAALATECHAVFLAQPGTGAEDLPMELARAGVHVFDLFAEYRFRERGSYSRVFRKDFINLESQFQSSYGLPELYRTGMRGGKLTAMPGAVPTAAILAIAPLARQDMLLPGRLVMDCKTGASAVMNMSRRVPSFLELNENIMCYTPLELQHRTEIEEQIGRLTGEESRVTYTETLVPVDRGVLATCYATLREPTSEEDLRRLYATFYAGEPFIRICDAGRVPSTKSVLGTNRCEIGLRVDEASQRLVLNAAIDNLGKGSAGQAVQAFNANYGLDETLGLAESPVARASRP